MPRIKWTPTAERDLDDIFDYIGREQLSPTAAANVLRQINDKCSSYARQPQMGSLRPDLGSDVRCFPVAGYVVIYRPLPDGILVLIVVHGARDIPAVFRNMFGLDNE